jgi:hypothetical protein
VTAPPHMASVGIVEAAGQVSPGAQLWQEDRLGAPSVAEKVPTGQAKQVARLVALSVVL